MHLQKHHYTPGSGRDSLGQEFHIDYAGPFEGEMFLVVMDAYSKWLEVHRMKSITSTATIEKLREMFATRGLPATLVSDNGSNFTSSEFQEFITHHHTSKWHLTILPQMAWQRGLCESLKKAMRRWRMEVSKRSYHDSSLVTEPPPIVRQEFHQQNYS